MKWLVTILAILVGGLLLATLKLANVKHVDTSAEALRELTELRKALQVCEATKRRGDVDAPAQARTFEDASRPNEKRTGKAISSNACLKPSGMGKPPHCGVLGYSRGAHELDRSPRPVAGSADRVMVAYSFRSFCSSRCNSSELT